MVLGGSGAVRLVLLALVGGMLVAFGGTPTATAATVVPCVQTFTQNLNFAMPKATASTATPPVITPSRTNGLITVPVSATMSAAARVEDVDVRVDIDHAKPAGLQFGISAHAAKGAALVARNQHTSANIANVTFDDEAATKYAATSGTGRFKPYAALTAFDGTPAAGAAPNTWAFYVYNYDTATAGTLKSWAITLTLSVCDGDGDSAEDHVDNCVGLVNPDQVDLDGDGIGNECDDDLDGDGVLNNADNCLTLANADQADADGDGSGDRCDGDRDGDGIGGADNCPTVANQDQADTDADGAGNVCDLDDDADGRPDAVDRCPVVGAPGDSGCPSVDRSLKLSLTRKERAVTGRITAEVSACLSTQHVTVWQARRGKDRRLDRVRTNAGGKFDAKLGRRTGKFYAKVSGRVVAGVADCSAAKSRKVTVRRR